MVAPIVEKIVESCLRWFGHVEETCRVVVRRVDWMKSSLVTRGRGRHRKTIVETVKRDLNVNGLNINMISDRALWHRLIHIADST